MNVPINAKRLRDRGPRWLGAEEGHSLHGHIPKPTRLSDCSSEQPDTRLAVWLTGSHIM